MSASRIGLEGTSEVVMCGGTGSGSVFSSVPKGSSASVEASDIEIEVGGRAEEG